MRSLPFFWIALCLSLLVHGTLLYFMQEAQIPHSSASNPTLSWSVLSPQKSASQHHPTQHRAAQNNARASHQDVPDSSLPLALPSANPSSTSNGRSIGLPLDTRLLEIRNKIE